MYMKGPIRKLATPPYRSSPFDSKHVAVTKKKAKKNRKKKKKEEKTNNNKWVKKKNLVS